MSTLSETNHSLHHTVPSTISNRTFRQANSANSLSSIDSHFARHVRRYRDIRLLRVVFQSMLQPSVRWQHTRLTGKKDYSREKIWIRCGFVSLEHCAYNVWLKKYIFIVLLFLNDSNFRVYDISSLWFSFNCCPNNW